MAKTVGLKAKVRSELGRNRVKVLRRSGVVPAVIYGGEGTRPLEVVGKDLLTALHSSESEHVLVDLEIEGETGPKRLAVIHDVQHDPLKDKILHIDLHELNANETMHSEVAIHEFGESAGVKNGGILDHVLRSIRVECLPRDLPDVIRVDISNLEIGDAIHVKELPLPKGVVALHDEDQVILMVHEPKVVEEAAVETAAAQPEVITAKKTDEAAPEKK
jgi:large subunit ribosomal protein L25